MPIRNMVLTGLFAALLSISSQIYIPIGPVPHTLQLIFVLLAGIMLGSRWGSASVVALDIIGRFRSACFCSGQSRSGGALWSYWRISCWIYDLCLVSGALNGRETNKVYSYPFYYAGKLSACISNRASRIYGKLYLFPAQTHDVGKGCRFVRIAFYAF